MSTPVIVDGDGLQFTPMFGPYTVTPQGKATISGTGNGCINNKKICIAGDEKKVRVAAQYTSPACPIFGQGTLTIVSLASDQMALFATAPAPIILAGSQFTALFTPESPARGPNGLTDPMTPAPGSGNFIPSQFVVLAG